MVGYWSIHKKSNGELYALLHAINGQVIATTEDYLTEAALMTGITSIRKNSITEEIKQQY